MKSVKMNSRKLHGVLFAIPLLLFFVSGCGGGGTEPATITITGAWEVTETILEATGICAANIGRTSTWTANAVQSGNDVTVTITGGDNVGSQFTGTISGNHIDWQGSYPSDGGTVTVTGTDVTATNTSFSGTSNWEWTDGQDSCTGKTTVTGNKT